MMDVLYFAWVRERIGLPKEKVETSAATVAELVEELKAREERYAAAFADLSALRVALDQELAEFDAFAVKVDFGTPALRPRDCTDVAVW